MIYESCEKSRAGTKEYHNAVFVGSDEYGAARHAHKRGLYTQGKSFRGNVEGGDPRCSFHWFGHSGRLYVFEAPIDMLAFLTLNPEAWKEHSYVSLCGTSEHAMLWMLEKDPRLQKVVLCLDHDAAGIEATGRLNVRSGPGLNYDDKGTLLSGSTATYLNEYSVDERGVTWYKISYNGGSGWVSSRYCELH